MAEGIKLLGFGPAAKQEQDARSHASQDLETRKKLMESHCIVILRAFPLAGHWLA